MRTEVHSQPGGQTITVTDQLHQVVDAEDLPMAPREVIRRRKLLSQAALAQRSGVSGSTIYPIEDGRSKRPRRAVMPKLGQTIGVEPVDVAEFRAAIGLPEPEPHTVAA